MQVFQEQISVLAVVVNKQKSCTTWDYLFLDITLTVKLRYDCRQLNFTRS